jgi:hypothetical protein
MTNTHSLQVDRPKKQEEYKQQKSVRKRIERVPLHAYYRTRNIRNRIKQTYLKIDGTNVLLLVQEAKLADCTNPNKSDEQKA